MEDVLENKTYELGMHVVVLSKNIKEKFKEYDISRQFLRAGTSVGANVAESRAPHSRLSFIAKLTIARQECKETLFWIEMLQAGNYISEKEHNYLKDNFTEVLALLCATIYSSKYGKYTKKWSNFSVFMYLIIYAFIYATWNWNSI